MYEDYVKIYYPLNGEERIEFRMAITDLKNKFSDKIFIYEGADNQRRKIR